MIQKKEGIINGIIYDHTIYNNYTNSYYPTINNLKFLIKELVSVNATTSYVKFNPFYVNGKLKCQIEFDDYMFYMECRDNFTNKDLENHWTKCMDNIYDIPHEVEQYKDMDEYKKKMARILYPICKTGDYCKFHESLNSFVEFLDELIPLLFSETISKLNLSQDDIAFGYFCFEVHSG